MNRQGRGSTGPGRPSAMPDHSYEPPEPVRELTGGRLLVAFHGDDDRRRLFDVSRLPLPGWHQTLAAAVAERTGPSGGLRTFSAAAGERWAAWYGSSDPCRSPRPARTSSLPATWKPSTTTGPGPRRPRPCRT
jgi:hypothetical protein